MQAEFSLAEPVLVPRFRYVEDVLMHCGDITTGLDVNISGWMEMMLTVNEIIS